MRPVLCRVLAVCAVSVAVSLSFTEGAPLAVPLCMLRKCALIDLLRSGDSLIQSHARVPVPEAPKFPSANHLRSAVGSLHRQPPSHAFFIPSQCCG